MIRFLYFLLIFLISTSLSFCNRRPYGAGNKAYKKNAKKLSKELVQKPSEQTMATAAAWVGTTNFNLRKPNIVVIHHTAQKSCGQTLNTFTTPSTSVSAHYVICEDGTVHHMLNEHT
jgi:N-acetylmuramoyl-L-alanine amidase